MLVKIQLSIGNVPTSEVIDLLHNDAEEKFGLGMMYQNGDGVPQSFEEAAKWYRKAADQDLAEAQFNLGALYFEGHGVEQSFSEAVRWITLSACNGYVPAVDNMKQLKP